MKIIAIFLIRTYRYLASPWLGQQCRFYPSCSNYAEEAISTHGFLKGSWMAGQRLCKCHPWHPGGVDLVEDYGQTSASKPDFRFKLFKRRK